MRARLLLLVAAVLITMLPAGSAAADVPKIEVGRPFPDIALPALDAVRPGITIAASQLRGHKVVLHVFASW